MDILFVLIPVSIVLILFAIKAFAWSIDSGQFDELDRESQRILFDRETPTKPAAGNAGSAAARNDK